MRLLPRTAPDWLFILVCLGLGFVGGWLAHGPRTVYAAGYDKHKFKELTIGMTRAEVERLLGPPLHKEAESQRGFELWMYSLGETSADNYWRQWGLNSREWHDLAYLERLQGLS